MRRGGGGTAGTAQFFIGDTVELSPSMIRERLDDVRSRIDAACARSGRSGRAVRLIVVTKTHPAETVQAVIDAGAAHIGENRVQEIMAKAPLLHGTRVIHMIGHLQTNKVSNVVGLVDWIQSVDSERLLEKIEQHCRQLDKRINVCIQVNTSGEQSKSGCAPEETERLWERAASAGVVGLRGLMTIGPLSMEEAPTRKAFALLRALAAKCTVPGGGDCELSMGMSGDFEWAVEEGATMVRIGSSIIGERAAH
jgi:hypothetical protein